MGHKIIATYCLIDEILKGLNVKNDVRAKITNAEIRTMGYLAVSDLKGVFKNLCQYLVVPKIVSNISSVKSRCSLKVSGLPALAILIAALANSSDCL